MPFARSRGVRLYYEESGRGFPLVFLHEFAGDVRSWEPQLRHFSRLYRCVAFNARGFPPSDVPKDRGAYAQAILTDDVAAVLGHLGIRRAHVVGLSMGANVALDFAIRYPRLARSVVVAGLGYGSAAEKRAEFEREVEANARAFESRGAAWVAAAQGKGPLRVQLLNKDPRAWAEFVAHYKEHSARGAALTLRGVQKARPTVYQLERQIRRIRTPVLMLAGDEDEPCLEPALFLKRAIPRAGLWVFAKTGHAINLEEPDLFNQVVADFFHRVEAGRWDARDPRAVPGRTL